MVLAERRSAVPLNQRRPCDQSAAIARAND
jgi:hypothetical protein